MYSLKVIVFIKVVSYLVQIANFELTSSNSIEL